MQLKCETLLLLYTDINQTVVCRVKCQSFSTNDGEGLNKTCRHLTNEQWQLFDNCIKKSLNENKRHKVSQTNYTYNLGNIDVIIKASPISYHQLKNFIHFYDDYDLMNANIKHIWDCWIVVKQNSNLSPKNFDVKNVPEYEPLAIYCHGNDKPNVVTYKPSKPAVDVEQDIDLKNYVHADNDNIHNDIDDNDDDAYQPMSFNCTNSITENITPQYKPSPIKNQTNKCNDNGKVILTLDCDESVIEATPPLELPLKSLKVKLKSEESKSMDELTCFEETEYIPSGSGPEMLVNSQSGNVPQYIPTPINCTNTTKQSTLAPSTWPGETSEQLKSNLGKNVDSRNVVKMKTHKSKRKINAIKNWNIDDANYNKVPLRRSSRPQRLIEKLVKNEKCDKKVKCNKNLERKSIKLSAKHKELFGSDYDDDDDNNNNNNNNYDNGSFPVINCNTKNTQNNDDDDNNNSGKIKNKRKRDPTKMAIAASTTTTSTSTSRSAKVKKKSNGRNCLKSSMKEKAKNGKITSDNDNGDVRPKPINANDNKQVPNARKYLPTKEEIENIERVDNLRGEQALKWKEHLHQMQSHEIKVTQYLTLKDMSMEEIMITFDTYKPYLDEIYTKCRKTSHIKSFNGLNHCFVFNLIEENLQTKMLQKLCEIYCRHSNTTHPTMLGNAILPEWLMRIFMHKHQLNRHEAMEQIKAQETSRLNDDENDSLFNIDL